MEVIVTLLSEDSDTQPEFFVFFVSVIIVKETRVY